MATIRETFFISMTQEHLDKIKSGETIHLLAFIDRHDNGDIDETVVNLALREPGSKIATRHKVRFGATST